MLAVMCAGLPLLLVGCARSARIRPLPPEAVIVAFGDSLTAGFGAEAGQDYPAVLAKLSGWQVVNAGVPGELSATGRARLPGVLEEHRPALVILCHGGNDILTDAAAETIAANVEAMIQLCRAAGADVLLVAVPQKGISLSAAPFYAELAKTHGVPCDEAIIARVLRKGSLKSDYVHPNAEGYAHIAAAVFADLRRAQR
ncbi:MAG: arylesterase [Opitutaceae bacterium]|nr:arylesterase [Opitutaceae bacterium]